MLKGDSYANADDTIYLLHPVDYVKMYTAHKFYVGDEHVFTLFRFHSVIQSIKTLRKCFRTVCEFQPNPEGMTFPLFLTRLSNTTTWLLISNGILSFQDPLGNCNEQPFEKNNFSPVRIWTWRTSTCASA